MTMARGEDMFQIVSVSFNRIQIELFSYVAPLM